MSTSYWFTVVLGVRYQTEEYFEEYQWSHDWCNHQKPDEANFCPECGEKKPLRHTSLRINESKWPDKLIETFKEDAQSDEQNELDQFNRPEDLAIVYGNVPGFDLEGQGVYVPDDSHFLIGEQLVHCHYQDSCSSEHFVETLRAKSDAIEAAFVSMGMPTKEGVRLYSYIEIW